MASILIRTNNPPISPLLVSSLGITPRAYSSSLRQHSSGDWKKSCFPIEETAMMKWTQNDCAFHSLPNPRAQTHMASIRHINLRFLHVVTGRCIPIFAFEDRSGTDRRVVSINLVRENEARVFTFHCLDCIEWRSTGQADATGSGRRETGNGKRRAEQRRRVLEVM
jgi:hypothetical protein